MRKFTHWIVQRFIADYHDVDNVRVRFRYGALEAWTSIIVNLLLFVVKAALGWILQSVALIADAVHTLSDTGTSIIILIGFKIARKPGDREHPFGHGRAEPITALIVAVVLIVAGIELLKSSGLRILHPQIQTTQIGWIILCILVGTIIIKEMMARFARELGRMILSKTLEADFWHHRSDALSTVLVLLAMAGARLGYAYVDGVAGVSVALIIIYSGYVIARDAVGPLLGERPSKEVLSRIEDTAGSLEGVKGVHDVIVHRYGQKNLVSLHIEVQEDRPIGELHDLSERVEAKIEQNLGFSAVVHLDPLSKKHERYGQIHEAIRQITGQDERISGFHDLRIVGQAEKISAIFDITIGERVSREETESIVEKLQSSLAQALPDIHFTIKAEPRYAYSR